MSDTTVSAAPITPDQRLSNIVPSGDDAVASLNIIESQDAVVFIAEPTAGNKKLYLLSSASTATPNLSKISDFIAGGNDSPTILKVDAINNVLFVGIQTTASIRQLAVIPFSKLSPNLVVADYIIAQDDMTGGPDMISTAAATGWAWVRMIDGSGAKHLYRIEL